MGLMKHAVRYTVITGLVGGTAALVAGPDRLGALFESAQNKVNQTIDEHIDDPVAMRHQMRALAADYPNRIAQVRADLAELRQQKAQLERERDVSQRVVSLANADFDQIRTLIDRAEATRASLSPDAGASVVRVVFNDESINIKDAYQRANKIRQVNAAYASRCSEIERDLGYLAQQEDRLAKLAEQLETEHTEFQSQMWTLDRQVDQISRNDRLIDLMEKRQRTIDQQSRYQAGSLDQLAARFADIRAKQEARLDALGSNTVTDNYEDRAKFDLDARKAWSSPSGSAFSKPLLSTPGVIEIRPDDLPSSSGSQEAPKDQAPTTKGPGVKPAAQLKPLPALKPFAMK